MFFSIRWKLSLALVGLSFGLVSAYILVARETFESDKISYVFESEQTQLEAIEKDFSAQIENGIFLSKSILSTFDSKTQKLTSAGEALFDGQKTVEAFELRDLKTNQVIASVIPTGVKFSKSDFTPENASIERLSIESLLPSQFLLRILQKSKGQDSTSRFQILMETEAHFPKVKNTEFILSKNGKIISQSAAGKSQFTTLTEEISRDRSEKTEILKYLGREYLVSHLGTRLGDFQLTAIISKDAALGALDLLYQRSLIFVFFSGFITIVLVLFLSGRITQSLELLTSAARRLGEGDFTDIPAIRSKDEVGILSRAFSQATIEIKRLLIETREKARMESEIKSASVIQETLLPKVSSFKTREGLNLSGFLMTATECSGDWWYYLDTDDRMLVAIWSGPHFDRTRQSCGKGEAWNFAETPAATAWSRI